MTRPVPRPTDPYLFVAALITALLHLGVFGGLWLARARASSEPPLSPGNFVDAQLVKFGKPRDLKFLPHKQGVVKDAEPDAIKVARDLTALPHLDDKPPDPSDRLKKTHAELFKHLADQPEGMENVGEGSLTGSRAGTATEARGDPYILSLIDQIGTAWTVPTTIKDKDLVLLTADVCLTLSDSGTLIKHEWIRRSGNSQFDSSLEATLGTIHKLPPPPDRFRSAAARGKLCPTFAKQ